MIIRVLSVVNDGGWVVGRDVRDVFHNHDGGGYTGIPPYGVAPT
jgi:hypothetical protein